MKKIRVLCSRLKTVDFRTSRPSDARWRIPAVGRADLAAVPAIADPRDSVLGPPDCLPDFGTASLEQGASGARADARTPRIGPCESQRAVPPDLRILGMQEAGQRTPRPPGCSRLGLRTVLVRGEPASVGGQEQDPGFRILDADAGQDGAVAASGPLK